MLKEAGKWLWGTPAVCPHCGGGLPLLRSPESPQTLHGFVCPGCGSELVRRAAMEWREAVCMLWLCGSLAFAAESGAYVLGLAMASLATLLLLRSQITSRLVVRKIGSRTTEKRDIKGDGTRAAGFNAKTVYSVRPVPTRVVGAERRRLGQG
jgi:hypothetical protein